MPVTGIGSAAADDAVENLVSVLTTANAAVTTANAALAAAGTSYVGILPAASSYTYNSDGTIATETVGGVTTTYTYNSDGTIATQTRSAVTRTYSYNSDGTVASVS